MHPNRSRIAVATRTACALLGIVGVFAAMHCGSGVTASEFGERADPCQTFFKDQCGGACSSDLECTSGLYCGFGGRCTADCVPGEICQNAACSARGRCGGDPNTAFIGDGGPTFIDATTDTICADTNVTLTKVVPKVLFLLDQSSSMYFNKFPNGASNNCNPDCRWSVLKDVLIGPAATPGGVVKQLQGEAELGVKMYSATDPNPYDGDNSLLPPPTDDVCPRFNGKKFDGLAFALNNAAAIDAMLRPAGVDDDTPTGPAIRTVAGLAADGTVADPKGFAALPGTAPKVIVLVTDGEPMLCGENAPSDPGRAAVVLAAQHAYAQKIRTFVIAIGDTTPQAQAHFKSVANAGQGKDPATGDAVVIQPSTPKQLVDALQQIVLDARTCTFTLNGQVQAGSEKQGTVTLNGKTVPYDDPGLPDEGWHLKTSSTLELVGEACKTLKSTPNATLSASFPCGTILPLTK
jgi:hypothetical protein